MCLPWPISADTWLNDRLAAAQIAALVLDAAPDESLPQELEMRLLAGVGAQGHRHSRRRKTLAARGRRRAVGGGQDHRSAGRILDDSDPRHVRGAFRFRRQPLRVIGSGMGVDFVELILDPHPLRACHARILPQHPAGVAS